MKKEKRRDLAYELVGYFGEWAENLARRYDIDVDNIPSDEDFLSGEELDELVQLIEMVIDRACEASQS